jgi:toxin ParE1/3/4
MASAYRLAPAVRDDLDTIWEYIAEHNPTAAAKWLAEVQRIFALLANNPLMGRARNELMSGLRSVPVGRYLVFYQPVESEEVAVEIIRVLHGARDLPSIFG